MTSADITLASLGYIAVYYENVSGTGGTHLFLCALEWHAASHVSFLVLLSPRI
jgi:hypothetical protein